MTTTPARRGCCSQWKPVLVMIAVDVAFAVVNVMIKKALDEGLNRLVLITLRQLVATLFMAPIAYFSERKTRPKLSVEIFVYLFFSAMFGTSMMQYAFFFGMEYTSATFACAFLNFSPVLTFLISLAMRMETLKLKTKEGVAKSIGVLLCVVGVVVLILYQGVPLNRNAADHPSLAAHAAKHSRKGWLLGSMALVAGCFCWSAWFPLQSKLGKKYPVIYSATALMFLLSFLQSATLSLATQRGISIWLLRKKMEIATVVFSGVVGSGLAFLAMSWCVKQRGPVFTAAFTPLIEMIVAGIDSLLLREQIYVGSVLGSILVIAGLYSLLWGKNKDGRSSAETPAQVNGESNNQAQAQAQAQTV